MKRNIFFLFLLLFSYSFSQDRVSGTRSWQEDSVSVPAVHIDSVFIPYLQEMVLSFVNDTSLINRKYFFIAATTMRDTNTYRMVLSPEEQLAFKPNFYGYYKLKKFDKYIFFTIKYLDCIKTDNTKDKIYCKYIITSDGLPLSPRTLYPLDKDDWYQYYKVSVLYGKKILYINYPLNEVPRAHEPTRRKPFAIAVICITKWFKKIYKLSLPQYAS